MLLTEIPCFQGLLHRPLTTFIGLAIAVTITMIETSVDARTWTSTDGKKMQAIFVGIKDDQFYFKSPKGARIVLPRDRFVKADQEAAERFVKIGDDSYTTASARKIDHLLAKNLKRAGFSSFNEPLPDDLFVRRVYLDIAGRIPTREEFLAFAEDARPDKREILIDELLLSPGYASHLYNYFADMYRMNTYNISHMLPFLPYFQWWKEQLLSNRPYDEIVTELITAKGNIGQNPASGFLLRDRGMEIDAFANFSQSLLGIDLSCAQCHDHPFAEWTQGDFYQLAAFFGQTYRSGRVIGGPQFAKISFLAHAPEEWLTEFKEYANHQSDYDPSDQTQSRSMTYFINSLTSSISDVETLEMKFPHDFIGEGGSAGEVAKPATLIGKDQKIQAGQTRREALAEWLTSPDNPRFALTIANRMWARAFGQPLVSPVNDVTTEAIRGASQPEVFQFITSEMQRVDYDLREFMRILYRTRAYQSLATFEEPALPNKYAFQGPLLRRMNAEQAWDSMMLLQHGLQVNSNKGNDASLLKETLNIDPETMSFDDVWERFNYWKELKAGIRFAVIEEGDMSKHQRLADLPRRASEMPQPDDETSILSIFGQSERVIMDSASDIGSVPQVLTLMNSEFTDKVTALSSQIVKDSIAFDGPDDQVRSLYFALLNRYPLEDELKYGMKMIADFGDEGVSDLTWSLINSPEFLFIQ